MPRATLSGMRPRSFSAAAMTVGPSLGHLGRRRLRTEFAMNSLLEEDGFELLVPVVKRWPPREMEPGLCRTGPHFQRRMMALEGSFDFPTRHAQARGSSSPS